MADNLTRYQHIHACQPEFFHICYYCGDIANTEDFIPPKRRSQPQGSYPDAHFFIIPSCGECKALGGDQAHGYLEPRAEYIRKALQKKHAATFRKMQLWTREEVEQRIVEDGLTNINRSLLAVIELELDLTTRLNFVGYSFEVNGSLYQTIIEQNREVIVFGQRYDTPKQALHRVAKEYDLKIAELHQRSEELGNDIEKAAKALLNQRQQRLQEKQLSELADQLSIRYKQPKKWLTRTLSTLLERHPGESLESITEHLIANYFPQ